MKSRRRDPHAIGFGGYMLVDSRNIALVGGLEYGASIEDVAAYLKVKK